MICRVADSIYWLSRYIERAENIARFIDVSQMSSLGGRATRDAQWAPLIYASGDEAQFHKRFGNDFSQQRVLHFAIFDEQNPNSIISCVRSARENARSIRGELSTALWEAINRFYLRVDEARVAAGSIVENPHRFLERVKRSSHTIIGVVMATMSHGEAWSFALLARLLERADKTSRILDVKYFTLLPDLSLVGSTLDIVQWSALLESTSALHMYRKRFGKIEPKQVAEFLVLDRYFPRSMHFCVTHGEACLRSLTGTAPGMFSNSAEQLMGLLNSQMNYTSIDDIVNNGLHEFVDNFQQQINDIGGEVAKHFFQTEL
jgi:uncharacterized alpha-E superfamily protein